MAEAPARRGGSGGWRRGELGDTGFGREWRRLITAWQKQRASSETTRKFSSHVLPGWELIYEINNIFFQWEVAGEERGGWSVEQKAPVRKRGGGEARSGSGNNGRDGRGSARGREVRVKS